MDAVVSGLQKNNNTKINIKNMPEISIIMPVYNSEKYLGEAINSIQNQTFKDFELIIVDDFSTDNSKKIALNYAYADKRFIVISNKYKKGISGAINSGLDISRGNLIARADADDVNNSERLQIQFDFFKKHKDIDILGGSYKLFGNKNNKKISNPSSSIILAWKFITDTYFSHPTVMFRKSVLEKIPQYPEVGCEDFAFFSKIIHTYKGTNIKKVLINYRTHSENYTKVYNEKIKQSVLNTFKENFIFYTGSLEDSEIFYRFHAQNKLNLKNSYTIIKKSINISNKIIKINNPNRINIILKSTYLYSFIFLKIIKSIFKN